MLKREILDPQGQAVERALPSLGFDGVSDVPIGSVKSNLGHLVTAAGQRDVGASVV